MKEYIYDPHRMQNLQHDYAEVISDDTLRGKVYQALSRCHDESIPEPFFACFNLDFLIRIVPSPSCRFEVVPYDYAGIIGGSDTYPSPLPGKTIWTKDEIARVISEFPMSRDHLACVYNLLFCSDLRNPGEKGHSFAVPMKAGFVLIYVHENKEQEREESEPLVKWPSKDELDDIMHQLSVGGWRMPKGWTLKRTGKGQ